MQDETKVHPYTTLEGVCRFCKEPLPIPRPTAMRAHPGCQIVDRRARDRVRKRRIAEKRKQEIPVTSEVE